jgi:hypothetical protein
VTLPISENLKFTKNIFLLLMAAFLFNCSTANHANLPREDRLPTSTVAQTLFFTNEVQPLLNKRCVVCHTCNNAPCQLHLDAYDGIRRGATYTDLGSSILYTDPTRDKDAKTMAEWRKRNFFPVIPDPIDPATLSSNLPPRSDAESSLLYRFIELGHQKNRPGFDLKTIIEHREKTHSCAPNTAAFENFAQQYPYAGMPFGLPGLESNQMETIKQWIDEGAPVPNASQMDHLYESSVPEQINAWETTFNATSKARLMARYIYEHTFSAHIHIKGTPNDEWYELVRSSSPAPNPIEEIVTARPYDNPGKRTVYYRFKRYSRTVARPAHIPWEIDEEKLNHYKKLFLETPWLKTSDGSTNAEKESIHDPGYLSTNPFKYFKQIPARIRYQFLLENSQVIANAMIRGPACSGRVATNAIRDHFWVFFLKPESDVTVINPDIGLAEWTPLSELDLKAFVEPSLKYTNAMNKIKPQGFGLSDLWNGELKDPNALLTIFRHGTNASVHRGLIGGRPPTLWVLNFSNFERIYYNLVADFEPWGSSAHKASTWNYMSRHRAEAEERFISFLPEKFRKATRYDWTQGLGSAMNLTQSQLSKGIKTQVVLGDSNNPVDSLIAQMLKQYESKQLNFEQQLRNWLSAEDQKFVTPQKFSLSRMDEWETAFLRLLQKNDLAIVRYLPDVVYLRVEDRVYTILNHRFYKFNNLLALEKLAYEPSKNKIYLMRGLVGDHPELFADLKEKQLQLFLHDLQKVSLFGEWLAFKNRYFVRRNDGKVWQMSDWFMDWQARHDPMDAGIHDMREYDIQAE